MHNYVDEYEIYAYLVIRSASLRAETSLHTGG